MKQRLTETEREILIEAERIRKRLSETSSQDDFNDPDWNAESERWWSDLPGALSPGLPKWKVVDHERNKVYTLKAASKRDAEAIARTELIVRDGEVTLIHPGASSWGIRESMKQRLTGSEQEILLEVERILRGEEHLDTRKKDAERIIRNAAPGLPLVDLRDAMWRLETRYFPKGWSVVAAEMNIFGELRLNLERPAGSQGKYHPELTKDDGKTEFNVVIFWKED